MILHEERNHMELTEGYLQDHFLVAAPGIQDERFERTVIYIFKHNKTGAAGLIINKPSEQMSFSELCEQLSITPQIDASRFTLFNGGPVESNRGYVLHSNDFEGRDTEKFKEIGLNLTTTVDVIKRLSEGKGPKQALLALGYAAWDAGQLDSELTRHGWLYCKAEHDIIFDVPNMMRWETVIGRMGLNFGGLAEYTGRA